MSHGTERRSKHALIIAKRRQVVARLRLRGYAIREIVALLPGAGIYNDEGDKPWARGTIANDLKAIDGEWRQDAQNDIASWKALSLARIEKALTEAWKIGRVDYVLKAIEDERKLLGLDAPAKQEHSGMLEVRNIDAAIERELAQLAAAGETGITSSSRGTEPGGE